MSHPEGKLGRQENAEPISRMREGMEITLRQRFIRDILEN